MTEISELEARVIALALSGPDVSQVCHLVTYDPDVGRVPEHWRVKPSIMQVFEAFIRQKEIA